MLRVPALTSLVLALLLAAYWVAGTLGERDKLAALEPLPARADYRITLDFPPERFHQLFLQDKGRLVGVHGNVVDMMDVEPGALRAIARRYWVDSIARWTPR
jgi:hypothetical protein